MGEWFPRLIHFRGWAPFGADHTKKVDKTEATDWQRRISDDLIPKDDAQNLRWLQPFHINHCLTLELLAPRPFQAKDMADYITMKLKKTPWNIRDVPMRCAPETSPKRRTAVKVYYENKELAERLNPTYKFSECSRALELWDTTGMIRLAWYNRDEATWTWATSAARTCGIRTPHNMDCGSGATPINQDDEDAPQEVPSTQEPEADDMQDDKENERPSDPDMKRNAEDKDQKPAEKKQRVLQRTTTL